MHEAEVWRGAYASGAGEGAPAWLPLLRLVPGPLLKLVNALVRMAIRRDPAGMWVAMAGTVGVTAVGMFCKGSGWGLAAPAGHTLCRYVGGIARKPACVQDRIEPREILNLTVAFDHDTMDGAPAARFVSRLVELIEHGYGLDAIQPLTDHNIEPLAARTVRVPA